MVDADYPQPQPQEERTGGAGVGARLRCVARAKNEKTQETVHMPETVAETTPTVAAQRLQRWYRSYALPSVEEHPVLTARAWRRVYVARYPEEHLDALLRLAPRKLRRPELARSPRVRAAAPRRALRRQLARMSAPDMACLGW